MPKFQERGAQSACCSLLSLTSDPGGLVAKRYIVQERLGRGSFGTVYLVQDTKAGEEENLKVLKEIPVGDLNPNETVQANLEAQLLSQLHHPAILKFYASFLERDTFCIITEYCEDRDLDCKIEELRQAKRTLPERQVIEWFIQLLLGVHYMHQRRILHRDLKAKNIFLKKNIVKIGDFGVSRLLMGSRDLATTFTGTPYYMSPEALSHQGYDSKSDIWSLGCILYEMCCLEHAFNGHNFLSVVMKIIEGKTPALPERYSKELNSIMQRMLSKDPSLRLSAGDLLKMKFIEENMQNIKHKFASMTLKDKTLKSERDAAHIMSALQKKVHLQTLRERSEVQKMTPRERMRLRKLQAADEKARKLKQLAEEKYQENHRRMQELRCRNFQKVSVDVLNESVGEAAHQTQPITSRDYQSLRCLEPMDRQQSDRLCMSEPVEHEIPEDPQTAEAYYYKDGFESCSDEDEEDEEGYEDEKSFETVHKTCGQDSDMEAMVKYMEDVLESESSGSETVTEDAHVNPQGPGVINCTMAETRLQRMRESIMDRLGAEVFQRVYDYLKQARERQESEAHIKDFLGRLVEKPSDCFEVDQLLYFEEQLQRSREGKV
ncbi:serine/threonine-protein kinase Nek11 [Megalops cyprinoides]|uniref:serine/threonine-protein kinase Nek11 n=1 Tax=Megalops cyprinoides TaxID=118141 RepID=UPI001863BE41|nr:serine/threonine-protein kinase Nek11 [Megalops cyprinoides]